MHENIFGYLIRLASLNRADGARSLLRSALGHQPTNIGQDDIGRLSEFCRLTADELHHCSGLVRRGSYLRVQWQVCGHWVSRESFMVGSRARVCPACLREDAYVRGLWSLSLYTACCHHRCRLIETCPGCQRPIQWRRNSVRYCRCGFDFASGPLLPATASCLTVAELMELQADQRSSLTPNPHLSFHVHEHLAHLSIDGLCKTLWMLGGCLPLLDGYASSNGRARPAQGCAQEIIEEAMVSLADWPDRFGAKLSRCRERTLLVGAGSNSLTAALLGPVDRFFKHDMQDDELTFLRAIYEQHVQNIWRSFRQKHRRKHNERQLQLDFDA